MALRLRDFALRSRFVGLGPWGDLMLGEDDLRALRMRAQLLDRTEPVASPGEVVRRVCGVQAQDLAAAELALRARSDGLTAVEARAARVTERSFVRTWAMRGTLHLISSEDAGWLLPLVAPRFLPRSRRRLAQLGVEEGDQGRAVRLIEAMLVQEGALTREEIAERLARHGIRTEGQAAFHLISQSALEGLVCMGPDRGGKPTFVLLRDWIGPPSPLDEEKALAELARCYVSAYGPAAPEDMAAWSGLGLTEVRGAWRRISGELSEVEVAGGQKTWTSGKRDARLTPAGSVKLLAAFDNYLLGYRSRAFAVDQTHAREIHPGGGIIRPVALVDGQAAATWRSKRRAAGLAITVEPFEPLDPRTQAQLASEARDVGRFLGTDAELLQDGIS